jgi:transposase
VLDRHRPAQAPGRRYGRGHRRRCRREKNLIGRAYGLDPEAGLAVWCEDEAGPFQAVPHPGGSWRPVERPAIRPHEYVRQGTTKILTLFHPATGQVRVRPATRGTNAVLHGWLKETLAAVVAALPAGTAAGDPAATRALWAAWQQGLAVPFTLPERLPPLRVLLVWDNLAGHKTPEMVLWLCRHGIMPLYTPLGGSWLNMAESIQRILKRRALDGQQPRSPAEIGAWFEQTAGNWNRQPTPFVWNGKRRQRRRRRAGDGHPVGGSAALTHRVLPRHGRAHQKYRSTCQPTH